MDRYRDLVELCADSCRRFADRPLFGEKHGGAWEWTTYEVFGHLVDDLRGGLADLGVGAGDRVAIVSRNRIAWAVAAYATYGLGATFVPMYDAQGPDEWRFILEDSGARVVFGGGPRVLDGLLATQPGLPDLAHVISIDGDRAATGRVVCYDDLLARGREAPVDAVCPGRDAIAGFVYTSGTTGRPKGVLLSHGNLASNIAAATAAFPIAPDDRTVAFLPWAHVYGQVVELHILLASGASTAFNQALDQLPADLAAIHPTILVAVPRIFHRIHDAVRAQIATKPAVVRALFRAGLGHATRRARGEALGPVEALELRLADRLIFAKVRERFGGRLRYAISASAALSPEVARFVDALGIPVYEGYGLTETSPVVATNRPGARKLGSVGRPIPGVTVHIDEAASPVPGQGEIIVHGPNVMIGYHRRPEETARALDLDGGLHTGDLGYLDAHGYLYITGRIKEQYKLENGKYVMPTPLEQQLTASPYIAHAMLYGANRPFNVALIAIDATAVTAWAAREGVELEGDPAANEAVRDLIAAEIERRSAGFRGFERPRAFVCVSDELTVENGLLTPTLKLKRRELLARYGDRLEALYAQERATDARIGGGAG
jgi:long-chain acyl-CoA synthetase